VFIVSVNVQITVTFSKFLHQNCSVCPLAAGRRTQAGEATDQNPANQMLQLLQLDVWLESSTLIGRLLKDTPNSI